MPEPDITFTGMHFFVRDMKATAAFYRLLGFAASGSEHFSRAVMPDGKTFEFGSYALTKGYDPEWREPAGAGSNALQFRLATRDAVDDLFAKLTGAGHGAHLAPFDAFWGSRYAEVLDPDGNVVGFHSPRDDTRVSAPPGI